MIAPAPAGALTRAFVGAGALAIDAAVGEPPARLHPVVGMGTLLAALRRRSRAGTPAGQVAEGAVGVVAVGAAAVVGSRRDPAHRAAPAARRGARR